MEVGVTWRGVVLLGSELRKIACAPIWSKTSFTLTILRLTKDTTWLRNLV